MAVTGSGKIAGSVSGGCVEGAVTEATADVLKDRRGRLLHFGVADEVAWDVGLACGGSIDVFVNPLNRAFYEPVRASLLGGHPVSTVTVVSGPDPLLDRRQY
jgi:xanthine dehydrogenase accessory factor